MPRAVMEEVARYGYEKYGRRFFMQNNILRADNKGMKRKDWKILKEYASQTTIEFQRGLLSHRVKDPRNLTLEIRRTNFEGMFEQGLALGAKYFEVGGAEARDSPDTVKKVAEGLGK